MPMSSQLFFFFFTLIAALLPISLVAQNSGKVTVGKFLKATNNGSSWLSPDGDFAFGFHPLSGNGDLFLLSVRYAKIPDTIVWYAHDGKPAPQGSTVKMTAGQGLVLNDPQGVQLWSNGTFNSSVSYGFMDNTGNFMVKSSNNQTLWQSFDYPTDTLLPTQIIHTGAVVSSRLSDTNFTKGRFQLRLLDDGNLVLNTRDLFSNFAYGAYYISGTHDPTNVNGSGFRVVYNESGHMYIEGRNGTRFDLTPQDLVSTTDYYHRAILNFDGVFTFYYHPRSSTGTNVSWSLTKAIPDNICSSTGGSSGDWDSGACGYNSICNIGVDNRPTCGCPQNYSLVDSDDRYGSCKPDFRIGCEGGVDSVNEEYKLVLLQNADWPFADYATLDPCNEEDCKNSCLNDCFCAVAIFSAKDNSCWKKKLPLSNGRTDLSRTAWLKVGTHDSANLHPLPPASKSRWNSLNTILSVLLGSSIFVNFIWLGIIVMSLYFAYHKQVKHTEHGKSLGSYINIRCFSYQELEVATSGFKEELGRGAFGVVYKGIIGSGPTVFIAVKKLDRIWRETEKEFKNEVLTIGHTHHKNLVQLIGFCEEGDKRLLVYEYMSNGTLADYLFGDFRPSWTQRIQLAQGIARGLVYLHEECSTQIIHCDIKPQNILLDDYLTARISDFGLAKLLALNQSQTHTMIRGTKGYVAPEWFRNNPVTVKVDVYSFGVLLLEIICCQKNVSVDITNEERAILTDLAFDCYQSGSLDTLANGDMEALSDRKLFERLVMIAIWCIQEDPGLRPNMRKVSQMLEDVVQVPNPPCPTSISITNYS